MNKHAKILQVALMVSFLCLGAVRAYSQTLPEHADGSSVITNKFPDKVSLQVALPPSTFVASKKTVQTSPGQITTLDGKTYKNVAVQKVDPDGLVIGYAEAGGGIGLSKIKFTNLPDDLQRQYNYNSNNATAFEAREVQGMVEWRIQRQKQDEVAKRAAMKRAEQDALDQQQKDLAQQQKKEHPEMTEEQKKQAQKEIEATWSHMTSSVKAGRITN